MLIALLFLAACFVAFTNGANANFKGVASLYGSGTTSLKAALYWGTAMTFAGSMTAACLAQGMLSRFSGRGICPGVADPDSAIPHGGCDRSRYDELSGNSLWISGFDDACSRRRAVWRWPRGSGSAVQFGALGNLILLPLFFSPLAAALLGGGLFLALRALHLAPDSRGPVLDVLHFASSGAASFARGLNDTPKMVALLAAVPDLPLNWSFGIVAVMIALGGLLDADHVAETLAKKVTAMNAGQGFAASLATATLVTTASLHSLPVSTTHVSVGALLGIGVTTRQARWKTIGEILLAWVSTVPCAAALGAVAYGLISGV